MSFEKDIIHLPYITTCSRKDVVGSPIERVRRGQLTGKPRHTVSATESETALGHPKGTPT